jgi:hypothetical protein
MEVDVAAPPRPIDGTWPGSDEVGVGVGVGVGEGVGVGVGEGDGVGVRLGRVEIVKIDDGGPFP